MYSLKIIFGNKENKKLFIEDHKAAEIVMNAACENLCGNIKFKKVNSTFFIRTYDEKGKVSSIHVLEKIDFSYRFGEAENGKKYEIGVLSNPVKTYEFSYVSEIAEVNEVTFERSVKRVIHAVDLETDELVFIPEEEIYIFHEKEDN